MPEETDAARLARLRGSMGSEFREFVEIFERESAKQVDALERALASGDPAAARRAAHALRSSAGWVGLAQLAERLGQIEGMPDPVDQEDWRQATRDARQLRERGMEILRAQP